MENARLLSQTLIIQRRIFMKVILVDDEQLALDFLERQLNKITNIEVLGKFLYFDIKKKEQLIKEIDVAFLDIEMPEINGLELADQLLELNPKLLVVFVTAFNHYAVQAFELNALDYILKPIRLDRLQKTVKRIHQKLNNSTHLFVSSADQLEVHVCGELAFKLNDNTYEHVEWRTAKAKELFLYLLHYKGRTIRKSELIELLWPKFDQERAYSQLYSTVYQVRKTLEKYKHHFSLKNIREGYVLSAQNVVIDIEEWENKINSAPPLQFSTIDEYEKIMAIYTDNYLEHYDYMWTESERYRLEQLWIKKVYQIASFLYSERQFEKAEKWYVKIYEQRPEDEEAHFSLMKIYASLGFGLLVDHQYKLLKSALRDIGVEPGEKIELWYNEWKQQKI